MVKLGHEFASATAPSSVTGAAETAAKAKKAAARGLIKTYYGTLSSYLRRNYEYPRRARLAAIEGTVLIEIVVDREGKVLSTRVARSSGHEILDKAALQKVSNAAPDASLRELLVFVPVVVDAPWLDLNIDTAEDLVGLERHASALKAYFQQGEGI